MSGFGYLVLTLLIVSLALLVHKSGYLASSLHATSLGDIMEAVYSITGRFTGYNYVPPGINSPALPTSRIRSPRNSSELLQFSLYFYF